MGVKLGPLVLGTLLKHYLERKNVIRDSKARNELLFDEAFIIVKAFMEESTKHTVEELQQFSNTRIPSPPWVHCVRVMIPLSCCDEAAPLLLQALGGPDAVGGSKWWQVRGVKGVDAQWVAVKRDWRDAERRRKQRQEPMSPTAPSRFNSMRFKRETSVPDLRRSRTGAARGRVGPDPIEAGTRTGTGTTTATGTGGTAGAGAGAGAGGAKGKTRPSSAQGARKDQGLAPPKRPATSGASRTGSYGSIGRAGLDTLPSGATTPEHGRTSPRGPTPEPGHGSTTPTPTPAPGATLDPRRGATPSPAPSPGTATPDPKAASAPKFGEPGPEEEEAHYEPEMDDMRCMLYIHGGGYYFGSVDQQRFCVQRYARKMGGRVFAVNYRLAPQYPFPCALHDCLAAYLYLIRPPPGAEHLPVPPNMVIIAGDSAGGGMTLALLQIIRDVGLPAPAGGILISPWCDLTHSFPSVLINTATDIIPPYGLSLHKPSTLWPPPSDELTAELRGRMTRRLREVVKQGKSRLGLGNDSEVDLAKLVAESSRKAEETKQAHHHKWGKRWRKKEHPTTTTARGNSVVVPPQGATLTPTLEKPELPNMTAEPMAAAPEEVPLPPSPTMGPEPIPHAKPKRQATVDPSKGPIEIEIDGQIKTVRSQIQFYAQNHQLTHPLVSPALGYLGGLPPLFVLASDKEVLRDEIIYVAHKAAHPDRYPVKPETKELMPSLKDIESKGYEPTKVHLQVYDETCHVLPLFSFTTPAKYCYRAIALFCKHVTGQAIPSFPPTPALPEGIVARSPEMEAAYLGTEAKPPASPVTPTSPPTNSSRRLSITFSHIAVIFAIFASAAHYPPESRSHRRVYFPHFADSRYLGGHCRTSIPIRQERAANWTGFESPFKDNMIRERVSTAGVLRPLEPESELPACNVPLETIGTINASAVKRYLEGQALWDAKFSGTIKNIAKMRVKNLELARKEGRKSMGAFYGALANGSIKEGDGEYAGLWRGENPPPSSIVSRRDTAEARQLAICADRDLSNEESKMSGNNLWNIVVDFLSQNPDRGAKSSDPLAGDHLERSAGSSNFGIQVQPPTPSSPIPPTVPASPPSLKKQKSSGFLRKLMGMDSTPESSNTTTPSRRPLSLFIDSSRNSGLPVVEKP
ncbi:hypothetical protein OPQ81_010586 [Rhizoctonia solani]|nr:hypothetical protein OPQ81_010586 [Rhizoctonia solani]